jgi:hypothetical protein
LLHYLLLFPDSLLSSIWLLPIFPKPFTRQGRQVQAAWEFRRRGRGRFGDMLDNSRTTRLCWRTNNETDSLVFKPRPFVTIAVTEPEIAKVPFLLRLNGIASMILTRLHLTWFHCWNI